MPETSITTNAMIRSLFQRSYVNRALGLPGNFDPVGLRLEKEATLSNIT